MSTKNTQKSVTIHTDESLLNYLFLSGVSSPYGSVTEHSNREVQNEKLTLSYEEPCSKFLAEVKELSGTWGTHRFDKRPWTEPTNRIFPKLVNYGDIDVTEDEELGILTDRIIGICLCYLERSPELLDYALSKCSLSEKHLTDITALQKYHYIQCLDVSRNSLTTLAPLGQLPFLQYLDAAYNFLDNLLDFKAPFYLTYANFSHNLITVIPDLSEFWSITHLYLSFNRIGEINGLKTLRFLCYLDLSYNEIEKIEKLDNMRIQTLLLHHNSISSFDESPTLGFCTLCYIRTVDFSHNKLSSLAAFEKNCYLECINMSNNDVSNLMEIYHLRNLRCLSRLNLNNNPISEFSHYPYVCIRTIKSLKFLDDEDVTPAKRVDAKTYQEIDQSLHARKNRMELLLLQQINKPKIAEHIVPYDQPPPSVILIVGPPGSKKKSIVMEFVKLHKRLILGVSHTTRPKRHAEIEGNDYYFVTKEDFATLVKKGEFISVSEFNGYSFGIAHSELKKCVDSIIVFRADMNTALTLKIMGICPKLVLAMPLKEETHLNLLKTVYSYDFLDLKTVRIQNYPDGIKDDQNENFEETSAGERVEDDSSEDVSGPMNIQEEGQQYLDVNLFRRGSTASEKSNQFDLDLDYLEIDCSETSNKSHTSHTGILKNKSLAKEIRSTAVSFTGEIASEDSPIVLEEKLGSKRVSFSWFPNNDLMETRLIHEHHKSISDTMLFTETRPDFSSDNPLLSVLSSNQIPTEPQVDLNTGFMTLSERFEQMLEGKLSMFYQQILNSRNELLELHWSNPGLFCDVIFTDNIEESLHKLKDVLKYTIEHRKRTQHVISFEDDPMFKMTQKSRLDNFKLQEVLFIRR